jgi:hypothetical protein
MRKIGLIGGLLGVILLLAACSRDQPDITLETMRYDFGAVQQGEVATTEIVVRNTGQGDLRIETVSTSCGCTSAQVEPKTIAPGEEGRLVIHYDSGAHPDSGPIQRHIYVASNDPDEQEVEVIVNADVQVPTP